MIPTGREPDPDEAALLVRHRANVEHVEQLRATDDVIRRIDDELDAVDSTTLTRPQGMTADEWARYLETGELVDPMTGDAPA